MIDFSRYYIEYIGILLGNIADFFVGFFNIFKKIIIEDIPYYFTFTIDQAKNFNFIEWVALVVVTLINLAVFVFLALKIIQLLRRYFIFRRKEMDKQELVDEIAVLNNKVLQLIDEKNKILSVKVSQMTGKPEYLEEIEEQTEEEKPVEEDSRFVKLKAIDELYKDQITSIQMKQEDLLSLSMLIERFVNFSASQLHLYYTYSIIACQCFL